MTQRRRVAIWLLGTFVMGTALLPGCRTSGERRAAPEVTIAQTPEPSARPADSEPPHVTDVQPSTLPATEHGAITAPAVPIDAPRRPPTGRACRVHFRRDAMGLAAMAPLGLNRASSPALRAVQLDGVVESVSDHWLALRVGERSYWIPSESILAIEYVDQR